MNNQPEKLSENLPDELVTFLIPTTNKYLLLPNVTVAEIIHYRDILAPDDMPNWFLGMFDWRGQPVPLISFEALNEEPFQAGDQRKNIAILNGISNSAQLPFFALLTQGAPRLLRIAADEIAEQSGEYKQGPAELMKVSTNGEMASIPDLSFIETSVADLLQGTNAKKLTN